MALPLSSLPVEILREVRSRKWQVFLLFVLISFLVLGAGFVWPYKYKSEVVIFVDDQNIIRPLMEGSAITTEISDQASSARQTLSNRETLERVARDPDIYGPGALGADESVLEARIARLRANLAVRPAGGSYFSIGYSSESPVQAFRISQKLGQLFISESSQRKRMESRSAYDFIDKQVKSYEAQLAAVEQRLKNFLSQNKEGTEQEARSRMSSLKSQLELAQLERSELQTRVQSLRDQLNRIDPTVRQGRTADAFQQRISDMESQLDELRLRYLDSYPDIVILKEQIAELRNQQRNAIEQGNSGGQSVSGEDIVNPLYQDVRSSLSETLADMETTTTRINSLNRLIAEQEKRMDRIQESKAQYSEITRDMEVNTQIYNDLLRRREKARVSMHLDIEGQGLNFEIYESAQFPTSPSDLNFSMFAFAGVFLGALAPFGAIAGLLQIDPRIRARKQLEDGIGLPVLAEIPPVRTPFEKRRDRWVTLTIFVFAGVAVAVYVGIATAALMGGYLMADYKNGRYDSVQGVEEGAFDEERRELDGEQQSPQNSSRALRDDSRMLVPSSLEMGPGAVDRYVISKQIVKMQEPRKLTSDDLDERRIVYPQSANRDLVNRFRHLRTKLLEVSGGNNFTLVVSGAMEGAGTSFMALNLAAAFAFDQSKTALIIDCNLRNPTLHSQLDLAAESGLTDFLEDSDYDIGKIIYPTGIPRLRLIPAGSQREDAAEFFTSFRMKQFLQAIRRRYPDRFIVLDTAPISESPDARILGELCDYSMLVVPHGRITASAAESAARAFDPDKFVGAVING